MLMLLTEIKENQQKILHRANGGDTSFRHMEDFASIETVEQFKSFDETISNDHDACTKFVSQSFLENCCIILAALLDGVLPSGASM